MKRKIDDFLKCSVFVIKILFKNTPLFIILFSAINVIVSFIPAVDIILSKKVIDGLSLIYDTGDNSGIWVYIILLFSTTILNSLLNNSSMILKNFMEAKNDKYLNSIILSKLSKIHIKHLEQKDSIDAVDAAMRSEFYISSSFAAYIRMVTAVVTFISMISIVIAYYPLIALFYLLTTIPALIISNTYDNKMSAFEIDSIPETRKKNYYYYMLTSAEYAKDVRLYNLKTPFKKRYNDIWSKILFQREKIFKSSFRKMHFTTIVKATGYIGLYIYVVV